MTWSVLMPGAIIFSCTGVTTKAFAASAVAALRVRETEGAEALEFAGDPTIKNPLTRVSGRMP